MNLTRTRLWPYIAVSITLSLCAPLFSFSFKLFYFTPLLVVLFYQTLLVTSLWAALGCGLFLDALSAGSFFGLHVTSYCLAVSIVYSQKKHFFADNLSTLPILTALMGVSITLFQVLMLYVFGKSAPLGFLGFLTNIALMPLCDALYATLFFLLPAVAFRKKRRHGRDFFLNSTR